VVGERRPRHPAVRRVEGGDGVAERVGDDEPTVAGPADVQRAGGGRAPEGGDGRRPVGGGRHPDQRRVVGDGRCALPDRPVVRRLPDETPEGGVGGAGDEPVGAVGDEVLRLRGREQRVDGGRLVHRRVSVV
jgi:hypothetical protein